MHTCSCGARYVSSKGAHDCAQNNHGVARSTGTKPTGTSKEEVLRKFISEVRVRYNSQVGLMSRADYAVHALAERVDHMEELLEEAMKWVPQGPEWTSGPPELWARYRTINRLAPETNERLRTALQRIIDDGDYTAPEGMKRLARAAIEGAAAEHCLAAGCTKPPMRASFCEKHNATIPRDDDASDERYPQHVKEDAYRLDPECWVSYSGKPKAFKQSMEVRRVASLEKARAAQKASEPLPISATGVGRDAYLKAWDTLPQADRDEWTKRGLGQ